MTLPSQYGSPVTVVASNTIPIAGAGASGSPVNGNPVLVAGSDGTNTRTLATDSNGNQEVVGNVPSGSADSGAPVKVGGYGSTSVPSAVSSGQRVNQWFGIHGEAVLSVGNSAQTSDGMSNTPCLFLDTSGNGHPLVQVPFLYNGISWDRQRTPTIFKSAAATASGNSAVWTPTSGKRFRLMRFRVQVTSNAAQSAGGVITIGFQDGTSDMGMSMSVYVPSTAGNTLNGWYESDWIDLGNGFLSSAANNVLNVNLSAALSSGNVRVQCCGTEE